MNSIMMRTLDGGERQFADLASANRWARTQLDSLPERLQQLEQQARRIREYQAYLEQQLGVPRRRRSTPSSGTADAGSGAAQ